jgi:predicted enzyme related to lactoylglutathione lyase
MTETASTSGVPAVQRGHGHPVWIELFTPDTEAAATFYADLFGWTVSEPDADLGGYQVFERDGDVVAGMMLNDGSMGEAPNAWSVYLQSDDVAATAERATAAGAQVVAGPMQVTTNGHMLFLVDPAGAAVGVWQPLEQKGFAVRGQVGAPAWFECLSKDYDSSVAFYRDVFDWDVHVMSDTPEFRYSTLGEGDLASAGIMDASAFLGDSPSRWQFYVEVTDTDAAVARAEASGGGVAQPAEDTPYGRLAVLTDPAGVPFCVLGPQG